MWSKILRLGVMGTADIAVSRVISGLKKTSKVSVRAISSRDGERAKTWAKKLGIEFSFGSYEEMLNSGEIDAVYIPLPNKLHSEWSIKSMLKGKHVICEKPLATSSEEVKQMIRVSKEKKLVLMEAFMYRFHPRNLKVFSLVMEGAIGQLRAIESAFSYVLENPSSYLMDNEMGGGALYDVGCYCVNVSRMLTQSEPIEVYGTDNLSRTGVDIEFSGIMRFPKDVLSTFHVGMNEEPRYHYRVIGDKGLIDIPWAFVSFGEKTHVTLQKKEKEERIEFPGTNEYLLEFEDFADGVLENAPLKYDISDSLKNIYVLEALSKSAQKGRPVSL